MCGSYKAELKYQLVTFYYLKLFLVETHSSFENSKHQGLNVLNLDCTSVLSYNVIGILCFEPKRYVICTLLGALYFEP